jgi:hypothetical protein
MKYKKGVMGAVYFTKKKQGLSNVTGKSAIVPEQDGI